MAKYTLTNKAVADLSEIWSYTSETWSENQADKYYFMNLDTCQELAESQVKGKTYPELSIDIFGFNVGRHIIFYTNNLVGEIQIIRILHTQIDLKHRIQE